MIDIIYSLLCHESPECIDNLIDNIYKYNKNYQIKIVLHLNKKLFNNYSNEKVIINSIFYDKNINHSSIIKAHLENFNLIKNKELFKFFIPLASNCMFIKNLNLDFKINFKLNNYTCKDNHLKNYHPSWGINILKNEKLLNFFKNNKIILHKRQHEGTILPFELINKIYDFIYQNKLFDLITFETKFEEILLPTLEKYFTNIFMPQICKVYWKNQDYLPTIEDINNELSNNHIFIVKRIPRDINHPIRKFINELT
jgi:hypothetical protein